MRPSEKSKYSQIEYLTDVYAQIPLTFVTYTLNNFSTGHFHKGSHHEL